MKTLIQVMAEYPNLKFEFKHWNDGIEVIVSENKVMGLIKSYSMRITYDLIKGTNPSIIDQVIIEKTNELIKSIGP